MQAFSGLVADIRRRERWGRRLSRHPVFLIWKAAVGEGIARGARPVFVKNGTLWVEVGDSAWLQEMEMRSDGLIEALNARLEKKKLKALRFRVGQSKSEPANAWGERPARPAPPAWTEIGKSDRHAIDDALEDIPDAELKGKVVRLIQRAEKSPGERSS